MKTKRESEIKAVSEEFHLLGMASQAVFPRKPESRAFPDQKTALLLLDSAAATWWSDLRILRL
jgi:hypothetical protein